MKKAAGFNFIVLILVFLFFNTAADVQSQNNQSSESSDAESMTIYTLDPDPMIRQQENERAMTAYITGSQLMSQNRLEEAEKYLLEAVDLDPLFVDALDHLGIIYRRMNRLAEAESAYLRSIAINNKNRVPYINLAVVYRMQNRLNDALMQYLKVIEINPDDPEGYYGIGELYYLADYFEAAHQFFDAAIELYSTQGSPFVYHAYYYKGMLFYKTREYEEALRYFEEVQNSSMSNISGLSRLISDIRRILFYL